MKRERAFVRRDEGQAVVLTALLFFALLFFVGLAMDAGRLYSAKRSMQEAADAAAWAGAVVLYLEQPGTPLAQQQSDAIAAARADATRNGFTDGVDNTTVTVNAPPSAGSAYAGNNQYIEVIIQQQVRTPLVPAQATLNWVRSQGVAGSGGQRTGNHALLTLKASGTCVHFVSGSDIMVNTTPPYTGDVAINCSGSAPSPIKGKGAPEPDAGPGQVKSPLGTNVVGIACPTCVVGPLNNLQPVHADPYAGTRKPTASGGNLPKSCASPNLPPGYYADLDAPSCAWHLTGGVYIVRGGTITLEDFDIDETVGSPGVLIFMTTGNYAGGPGGPGCGKLSIEGTANLTVKSMTTGYYAGMAFFMDPACGSEEIELHTIGSFNFVGTFYAPTAELNIDWSSGSDKNCYCQLVVDSVKYLVDKNLTIFYDPSRSARPITPALVE